MSVGIYATANRGVDPGFVARQRARGVPDSATAVMGGWCLADVQAIPPELPAPPLARYEPKPVQDEPRLMAMMIPDIAQLIYHLAEQNFVSPEDILGPSHAPDIVRARHEAFAVVYEMNRYTLDQIGQIFNKTGSAILYGLKAHFRRLSAGPEREW